MFSQLSKYGKQVTIAGDLQLHHNFSMLDKQNRMSVERYRELLIVETAIWDMEMSWLGGLERTVRLAGRYIKHLLNGDQPAFRKETLRALRVRLFHSKKRRNRDWQCSLVRRFPDMPTGYRSHLDKSRPMVSVCMAAFNGEKYISQQLDSILTQLDKCDEVIVVDDASTDRTAEVVSGLNDPRIILLRRTENQGVVASFEQAIRSATGDILFLSDQDDIWAPNRVARTIETFASNHDLDLIVSDVALINEDGSRSEADPQLRQWPFSSKLIPNLIANRFQGSAMAFRSSLLQAVLPFPKNLAFLHDAWVGARCAVTGKSVGYISEPLLFYRRHGRNLSRKLSAFRMMQKRIELVTALLCFPVFRRFQ
jgi:hypothetical protein